MAPPLPMRTVEMGQATPPMTQLWGGTAAFFPILTLSYVDGYSETDRRRRQSRTALEGHNKITADSGRSVKPSPLCHVCMEGMEGRVYILPAPSPPNFRRSTPHFTSRKQSVVASAVFADISIAAICTMNQPSICIDNDLTTITAPP